MGMKRTDIDTYDLQDMATWSIDTFGPIQRATGVIDHIKKEIKEIEENPSDLEEWIDLITLALDGARKGANASPQQIIQAFHDKFEKNMSRDWPDWRTVDSDKAIEHIK